MCLIGKSAEHGEAGHAFGTTVQRHAWYGSNTFYRRRRAIVH
jgi:hypothetical protein